MPLINFFQKRTMNEKSHCEQDAPCQREEATDKGRKARALLVAAAATNIITFGEHETIASLGYVVLSVNTLS
jgi:hypothetical protein